MDLARWLEERSAVIAERWGDGLAETGAWADEELQSLGRLFRETLAGLLPGTLTPYRHQIEPLWSEVAELYGRVAARRGRSAGEVIEEFHALREVLMRLMFEQPPIESGSRLSLRELLRLNRILDVGVTQASVGHTDLLFFSLIHGSGVPTPMGPGDLDEVLEQVAAIGKEGHRIMRHLSQAHRS